MRYSPTLFRSRELADAPAVTRKPIRGEYGVDGDSWINAALGGGPDVNPALSGSAKFDVYDEMRKTDAGIKSLLMYEKLPIRAASWGLDPSDENDPLAVLIRDAVAWQFGLEGQIGYLVPSWDELLQQALQCVDFGAMMEELVWADPRQGGLVKWHDADGDEHTILPLERVAPRYPASIQRVDRDGDRITKVTQWTPGARPIPGVKISYLVFEREGNRWDGVSMLRPAWGAWWVKKNLMIAAGIGWDRFASGLPVVWHPDTPEGKAEAKKIGRGVRQHEQGYVAFPVEQGGSAKEDSEWLLELLNGAQTIGDPTPFLRWLDEQISEAGMQQFTKLGTTETGSRAVGEVQIDPFYMGVEALANYVRRQRIQQLIAPFVAMNFGRENVERRLPILTVSKIQVKRVEVIAKAIALLADAGFTFTDRGAQDDVRDMLGLARLPVDLDQMGIPRDKLLEILRSVRLDRDQFNAILGQLPEELGVAANRDERLPPGEGDSLLDAA
jgi:hypothetical protein